MQYAMTDDAKDRIARVASRNARHHCTSDHVFSQDEDEALAAIDHFKRVSGKNFPTYTDILGVLQAIGYAKVTGVGECEEGFAPPGDGHDVL